jgi:hypothetical protein
MPMTDKEKTLFSLFKKEKVVTIEQICKTLGLKKTTKNRYKNATSRLTILRAKAADEGCSIRRVSGLGAGAKGKYTMTRI